MNAMNLAINEINFQIPLAIRQAAFLDIPQSNADVSFYENATTGSMDYEIRDKVIGSRVIPLCNTKGANEIAVDLSRCKRTDITMGITRFDIPPQLLNHRQIVSVGSVHLVDLNIFNRLSQIPSRTGAVESTVRDMVNAVRNMPLVGTSDLRKTGPRQIQINMHTTVTITSRLAALVLVDNDPGMMNLNPTSAKIFADLCVLAAKAYIYDVLTINTDQGRLVQGAELGEFANILREFSSAEQDFQEYFKENWGVASFVSDNGRMTRFVNSMFGRM